MKHTSRIPPPPFKYIFASLYLKEFVANPTKQLRRVTDGLSVALDLQPHGISYIHTDHSRKTNSFELDMNNLDSSWTSMSVLDDLSGFDVGYYRFRIGKSQENYTACISLDDNSVYNNWHSSLAVPTLHVSVASDAHETDEACRRVCSLIESTMMEWDRHFGLAQAFCEYSHSGPIRSGWHYFSTQMTTSDFARFLEEQLWRTPDPNRIAKLRWLRPWHFLSSLHLEALGGDKFIDGLREIIDEFQGYRSFQLSDVLVPSPRGGALLKILAYPTDSFDANFDVHRQQIAKWVHHQLVEKKLLL